MNRVINFLKKIRLNQILTAFFAGMLLFVTQACNGASTATTPKDGDSAIVSPKGTDARTYTPGGAVTSPNKGQLENPYQGGMNDFSDVDPRTPDKTAIKAQSEALKENSQRNLQNRADSVEKYVSNVKEARPLENAANKLEENASGAADEVKNGFARGTKRGVENIKENLEKAPGYFKSEARDTVDALSDIKPTTYDAATAGGRNMKAAESSMMSNGKDLARGTQRNIEDTGYYVQDKANRAAKTAQRGIEDAGDYVQSKANEAAKATKRTFEKAGDAVKDAVD